MNLTYYSCPYVSLGKLGKTRVGTRDVESLVELERVLSLDSSGSSVSGLALWRQQLCAVAKVRFLKLKNERKSLMTV